jgi:hypothetical protein
MPREAHLDGYTVEILDTGPYPHYMVVPGLIVAQTETAILKSFEDDGTIASEEEAEFFMTCINTNMDNLRNFLDDLLCDGMLRDEIPKWEPAPEEELRPPTEMTRFHQGDY